MKRFFTADLSDTQVEAIFRAARFGDRTRCPHRGTVPPSRSALPRTTAEHPTPPTRSSSRVKRNVRSSSTGSPSAPARASFLGRYRPPHPLAPRDVTCIIRHDIIGAICGILRPGGGRRTTPAPPPRTTIFGPEARRASRTAGSRSAANAGATLNGCQRAGRCHLLRASSGGARQLLR